MTAPVDQIYPPAPVTAFAGTPESLWNYDPRNIAAAAGSSLCRGAVQAASGQIPAGSLPLPVNTDGSSIAGLVIQHDAPSTWPDGSIACIRYAFFNPAAIVAGGTWAFKWAVQQIARNATVKVSLANIQAYTDLKIKVNGGNLGSDTFTVSLNDILANFAGGALGVDFGANPLGGYEVTEQGPIRTTVRAWRYLKRDSDGASHKWVKIYLYASFTQCDGGGVAGTLRFRAASPNILGAVSGGTVGAASGGGLNNPVFAVWETFNGSTRITGTDWVGAIGGPLDDRTKTVTNPTSDGQNGIVISGLTWGQHYQVTSTGTLPGGLNAGQIYAVWTDGNSARFFNNRNDVADYANIISLSSAGTGTLTFTPLGAALDGGGFLAGTSDGWAEPIWLGATARPAKIGRIRNFDQLTCGTGGMVMPYDPTFAYQMDTISQASSAPVGYAGGRPGNDPIDSDINETGDGGNDRRIGDFDVVNVCWMYSPQNTGLMKAALAQASDWAFYQCHYTDETRGRRTVGNGGTYAGLGSSRDGMDYLMNNGHGGFIGGRSNGHVYRYQAAVDGSHMPVFGTNPYMYFGDDCYLDLILDQMGMLAMGYGRDSAGPTGTVYRSTTIRDADQPRSAGWATRLSLKVRLLCPDAHAEKPHYSAALAATANYVTDRANNNPAGLKNLGVGVPLYQGDPARQLWMMYIYYAGLLGIYQSGLFPAFNTAIQTVLYKQMTNYFLPEFGGRMHEAGSAHYYYAPNVNDLTQTPYPDIATQWANNRTEQAGNGNNPGDPESALAAGNSTTLPDRWADGSGNAMRPGSNETWAIGTKTGLDATQWTTFAYGMFELADHVGNIPNARPLVVRARARAARNGGLDCYGHPQFAPKSRAF